MAEREWKAPQRAALEHEGGNLLVSAAAGSGKTAVLTERIVRLIRDKNADITRMLVVTFTNAAADELRARVRAGLAKATEADRKNRHLVKQLSLVSTADICTIHAFCLKLIRAHFSEAGLSPDFRIADDGAMKVMKSEIMRDCIEEYYKSASDGGDCLLADVLGGAKSEDALDGVLLDFAKLLEEHGFDGDKIAEYADMLTSAANTGFLSSPYGFEIRKNADRLLEYYIAVFDVSIRELSDGGILEASYLPCAVHLRDYAKRLKDAVDKGDYASCMDMLMAYTPGSLKSVKSENQTEESLYFKSAREAFTKKIKSFAGQYFAMTESEAAEYTNKTAEVCRAAAPVLKNYFALFTKAKRDSGVVDFSDLENIALSLLYDKDGRETDIAADTSARYDHIFIDEYQDTNLVQDRIFSAVSQRSGRFLVGDIKQSIYSFRGAEPEIFASYRRRWEKGDGGATVFMNDNFRSDGDVVDFVNFVSSYIFRSGSVPFSDGDKLVHSKSDDAPVRRKSEVVLIDTDGLTDGGNAEADYVADRIAKMIGNDTTEGGRLIRGGDIAILLRSTKTRAAEYISALTKRGIKTENTSKESFYTRPEVLLALCVFNAVDNPMRDIYLAGAMMSPVFRFTADDLVKIRMTDRKSSLWQAVRAYDGDTELKARCEAFVIRLGEMRKRCGKVTADAAVRYIYDNTGLTDYDCITPQAKSNLIKLYDIARQMESGVFLGLYGFVSRISELMENESDSVTPRLTNDPDAVKIVTIHHSKGLEYPIVFLSDCAHEFNVKDAENNLIFDPYLGPAMRLPDETGLLKIDTPIRRAAGLKVKDSIIDEEMRNLYVGMTRARCHLIVTAKMKKPEEKLASAKNDVGFPPHWRIYNATSYIKWIIDALAEEPILPDFVTLATVKPDGQTEGFVEKPDEADETTERPDYKPLIAERLAFVYPDGDLSVIPAKLTVSKLSPDILDGDETIDEISASASAEREANEENRIPVPSFLSGKTGYTPAEAGIATHLFMQFCDFGKLMKQGEKSELDRLVADGFITAEIAERVNMYEISMFRRSGLLTRIANAREVRREFRFNAAMPACDFTKNEALADEFRQKNAEVIVQGVIDCVFVDADGKLVLVDYKTDHFKRDTDEGEIRRTLKDRHKKQLGYYRDIAEKMYGRTVDETLIYSLQLGDTVEV